jgi:hypothetical protein
VDLNEDSTYVKPNVTDRGTVLRRTKGVGHHATLEASVTFRMTSLAGFGDTDPFVSMTFERTSNGSLVNKNNEPVAITETLADAD